MNNARHPQRVIHTVKTQSREETTTKNEEMLATRGRVNSLASLKFGHSGLHIESFHHINIHSTQEGIISLIRMSNAKQSTHSDFHNWANGSGYAIYLLHNLSLSPHHEGA